MKINSISKSLFPIFTGFLVWIILVFNWLPYSIFELTHVQTLLIAAPLWLIPLSFSNANFSMPITWLAVSCGILFTVAYLLPQGITAGILTLPWFVFSFFMAFKKWQYLKSFKNPAAWQYVELVAYFYLLVGIFWAIVDRLGIQLLGYDPTIILLTSIHFHYAGFILPQVTSWLIKTFPVKYFRILSLGIVAGIPLVAIGISSSHFHLPSWIEVLSVSIFTIAAATVGILHIWVGLKTSGVIPKIFFTIGGLALLIGMALAFCYGWRSVFVIKTLTIPWMYAIHGTCNAVGFAFPVLVGWRIVLKSSSINRLYSK
jgi:YndJ-like protein